MSAEDRAMVNIAYKVGKRDAVAEILMLVREKGERAALREMATMLLTYSEGNPNPHAQWYLASTAEQHAP